jgi:hypothetical protein
MRVEGVSDEDDANGPSRTHFVFFPLADTPAASGLSIRTKITDHTTKQSARWMAQRGA